MNDEDREKDPEQDRKKKALKHNTRKMYSLCAMTFAGTAVIVFLVKMGIVCYINNHNIQETPVIKLIGSVIPNYAVFLLVSGLLLMTIPSVGVKKRRMKTPDLLSFLVMTFPVLFIGNLLGNAVSAISKGAESVNPVSDAVLNSNIASALIIVIIAPVLEELVFRKWLLDRTYYLGGGAAVIFSALCFALYHTNVVQFFYAFGLGLIFGYVYIRSGSIVNTVILHCAVNLFGGVIAPFAFSLPDWEALRRISQLSAQGMSVPDSMINSVLPGLMGFVGYVAVFVLLIAAGIISFVQKSHELRFPRREISFSVGENASLIFLNAGMIIFLLVSTALSIKRLI